MGPATTRFHTLGRAPLILAISFLVSASCSGTSGPEPAWATLSHVSGDHQTVTVNAVGLTDFPQPVLVHLDSLGTPLAGRELRVAIQMSGAPGPNGPYPFTTGADGTASMQLVASNIPGPVGITVSFVKCVKPGFFVDCDQWKTITTLGLSALAVR
jgi:hypothetical protein